MVMIIHGAPRTGVCVWRTVGDGSMALHSLNSPPGYAGLSLLIPLTHTDIEVNACRDTYTHTHPHTDTAHDTPPTRTQQTPHTSPNKAPHTSISVQFKTALLA